MVEAADCRRSRLPSPHGEDAFSLTTRQVSHHWMPALLSDDLGEACAVQGASILHAILLQAQAFAIPVRKRAASAENVEFVSRQVAQP